MTNESLNDKTREAFEARFPYLDLMSYSGKGYNSKITNRTWQGYQASHADLLTKLRSDEMVEVVKVAIVDEYMKPFIDQMIYGQSCVDTEKLWSDTAKAALSAVIEKVKGEKDE